MSQSHKRADSQSSYYFVSHHAGTSTSTRDAGDNVAVIETIPAGVNAERFEPRILDIGDHQSVHSALSSVNAKTQTSKQSKSSTKRSGGGGGSASRRSQSQQYGGRVPVFGYLKHLFGGSNNASSTKVMDFSDQGKVDPKVFFAAERTFLSWMHAAILLAGVSIAISAYAETGSASDIYGIMVLPISIVFMIYAMVQYGDRAVKIKKRSPGPYEDRWGPVVLGSIFCIAIVAELLVELFEQATNGV